MDPGPPRVHDWILAAADAVALLAIISAGAQIASVLL